LLLFRFNWPAILNITYNVVGGILTILVIELFWSLRKKWYRRRFTNVFGTGNELYRLVYALLVLRPDVKALLPAARPGAEPFVFVRKGAENVSFSASQTASSCEVRAASYIASALGRDGDRESTFVDDESLSSKLDVDFVSFGLISNKKTTDVLNNAANDLVVPDFNQGFFVWKKTGQFMCADRRAELDYGIVLKIHPEQFPERTWIACAGLGETGTSGSAWFLARKWKQLEERAQGPGQFVALIAVEPGKDESAVLVNFGKSPANI
jgi:hypothetical protein